jgi:hypothetical protein
VTVPEAESNYAREWRDAATDPPLSREAVWGFCPDLGNDDEGYGFILPVMFESLPAAPEGPYWRDITGERLRITRWAHIRPPEVPDGWISETPPA